MSTETNSDSFVANMLTTIKEIQVELNKLKKVFQTYTFSIKYRIITIFKFIIIEQQKNNFFRAQSQRLNAERRLVVII